MAQCVDERKCSEPQRQARNVRTNGKRPRRLMRRVAALCASARPRDDEKCEGALHQPHNKEQRTKQLLYVNSSCSRHNFNRDGAPAHTNASDVSDMKVTGTSGRPANASWDERTTRESSYPQQDDTTRWGMQRRIYAWSIARTPLKKALPRCPSSHSRASTVRTVDARACAVHWSPRTTACHTVRVCQRAYHRHRRVSTGHPLSVNGSSKSRAGRSRSGAESGSETNGSSENGRPHGSTSSEG